MIIIDAVNNQSMNTSFKYFIDRIDVGVNTDKTENNYPSCHKQTECCFVQTQCETALESDVHQNVYEKRRE